MGILYPEANMIWQARLAAVLPNPRHWSARAPGAYVQTRVAWILGQMGYGARNAPQEEPEPPASELPDGDDADDAQGTGESQPPAAVATPQDAPAAADTAPAAAAPPATPEPDHGAGEAPAPPAEAPPPTAPKPPDS